MTAHEPAVRLLLVDDNRDFCRVLAKRLTRRGFVVTCVREGGEAIRCLRGREFDVAILDLKLADMDGLEVLRTLRIMDPALPVLILTGHGSGQAAIEGTRLGASDYLAKPCELDVLTEAIRRAMARACTRRI